MVRNLYDIYMESPGNYIVSGSGGIGKTTQLLNIVRMLLQGNRLDDSRVHIPVYIRVKDFNTKKITETVLYDVIAGYFNHEVNKRAIKEMFENSMETHCFLIMLDGLNELNNYMVRAQTALTHIINNISEMSQYENVHFIITLRNSKLNDVGETIDMVKELEDCEFCSLKIKGLTLEQKENYLQKRLGENALAPETYLNDILTVPMLLRAFKEVYARDPQKAAALNTKYDLMREWLVLDTIKESEFRDRTDTYRRDVVMKVLPLFAFKVELAMLEFDSRGSDDEPTQAIQYETLLEDTLNTFKWEGAYREHISDTIEHTSLLIEKNHSFTHDLIREYLAVYYLVNHADKKSSEDVRTVFEKLNYFLDEPIKQREYLDFAELIYGAGQGETSLEKVLCRCGLGENESREKVYLFYYFLAGAYENFSERKLAYKIGWKAIELFKYVVDEKDDYDKAKDYNWLYYCVNKYKEDDNHNPYSLIKKARELLENMNENERPEDYDELYGLILSNTGSHYVSQYGMNSAEAEKWHKKCLEHRKKMGSKPSLIGTYRTLMTDHYYMGIEEFIKAYKYYREAINSMSNNDSNGRLSQIACADRDKVNMDIVLRAIGNEILILKNGGNFRDIESLNLKQEMIEELPCQIEHVYNRATAGRRTVFDVVRDLDGKLNDLLNWNKIDEHRELKECIENYKEEIMNLL